MEILKEEGSMYFNLKINFNLISSWIQVEIYVFERTSLTKGLMRLILLKSMSNLITSSNPSFSNTLSSWIQVESKFSTWIDFSTWKYLLNMLLEIPMTTAVSETRTEADLKSSIPNFPDS